MQKITFLANGFRKTLERYTFVQQKISDGDHEVRWEVAEKRFI